MWISKNIWNPIDTYQFFIMQIENVLYFQNHMENVQKTGKIKKRTQLYSNKYIEAKLKNKIFKQRYWVEKIKMEIPKKRMIKKCKKHFPKPPLMFWLPWPLKIILFLPTCLPSFLNKSLTIQSPCLGWSPGLVWGDGDWIGWREHLW